MHELVMQGLVAPKKNTPHFRNACTLCSYQSDCVGCFLVFGSSFDNFLSEYENGHFIHNYMIAIGLYVME